MKLKMVGIFLAILAGAGLLVIGQPTLDDRVAKLDSELNRVLEAREVQIDPAELIDLNYNNNIGLKIIDVRDEADFNLFHIIDSEHVTMEQIRDSDWVRELPTDTILVLVSNDEKRASDAWKLLSVQKVVNLYILAGGINFWIQLFDENVGESHINDPIPLPNGDDKMRHNFSFALGVKHPASDPDPKLTEKREYTSKVKSIGPAPRKSGGCG